MTPTKIKNFIKSHPILLSVARAFLSPFRSVRIIREKIFNVMDRRTDEKKLMINIGGGHYFRRHWRVLDFPSQWYSWSRGVINYVFDLTSSEPFPLSNDAVSFFYSSHTLEHIPQECCQHILDEIFRCLKAGGAVRLAVPDFDLAYEAFAKNDIDCFVKYPGACIEERFLDFFATWMKDKISPEELRNNFSSMRKEDFADWYTRQVPCESQKVFTGNHINWWNYEKLRGILKQAGFREIYRSTKQGSYFTEMRGVGRNCGFDSTHPEISLFVEAVKDH